jgi:hypothetical protein
VWLSVLHKVLGDPGIFLFFNMRIIIWPAFSLTPTLFLKGVTEQVGLERWGEVCSYLPEGFGLSDCMCKCMGACSTFWEDDQRILVGHCHSFFCFVFIFIHMCIHCWATSPPVPWLPSPDPSTSTPSYFQAEPVPLSCSPILLKRNHKR